MRIGKYVHQLKEKLAEHHSFNGTDNIFLVPGSDLAIRTMFDVFVTSNSNVITTSPCFPMYDVYSKLYNTNFRQVPYDEDLTWSIDKLMGMLDDETSLVIIANPNNPTGTYNSHQEVHCLLKNIPSSILVVLDCAYFEYVKKSDYVDPLALLNEFDNLLVTKSFSKIQGLASARIGYGIAQPELIEVLNRIRQPFNVNSFAQELACEAINDKEHIKKSIDLNLAEGNFLFAELTQLGLECIPSVGNFISFKGNFNGKEMFTSLMEKGVVVRPIDLYGMPDFLRVTIGTHQENVRFLSELKGLL